MSSSNSFPAYLSDNLRMNRMTGRLERAPQSDHWSGCGCVACAFARIAKRDEKHQESQHHECSE